MQSMSNTMTYVSLEEAVNVPISKDSNNSYHEPALLKRAK